MKFEVYILHWTAHLNQLLYSLTAYARKNKIKLEIKQTNDAPYEGAIIYFNGQSYFIDYSDAPHLLPDHVKYDWYFKRSLLKEDASERILPLNFHVNFSLNPLHLISRMSKEVLKKQTSRIEFYSALDVFSLVLDGSHRAKHLNSFKTPLEDHNGKIIFLTRLWNPDNTIEAEEKKRRDTQNEFRINAVELINKNFKNAIAGLERGKYAQKVANSLTLDPKITKRSNYMRLLKNSDIGVADDGLFDTPGWKIGEYVLSGKAIISTPIRTLIKDFEDDQNYLGLSARNAYDEVPAKIENLLANKKYMQLKQNNRQWYENYMEPIQYIKNIFEKEG